jgi:hypothetical protein
VLGNKKSYILKGLKPWTNYKIRLVIDTTQQNISDVYKQVEDDITTPETGNDHILIHK